MGLRKIFYPEFSARGTLQQGLFDNTAINNKFKPYNKNTGDKNISVLDSVVWDETQHTATFDLYKGFSSNAKERFKDLYDDIACELKEERKKDKGVNFLNHRVCCNLKRLLGEKKESDEWVYFVILTTFQMLKKRSHLYYKFSERDKFNEVRTIIIEWADNLNTKALNTKLAIHALFAFGALSNWNFYIKDVRTIVKLYHSKLDEVLKYIKLLKYKIVVNSKTLTEVMTGTDTKNTVLATLTSHTMKRAFGTNVK